MSGELLRRAQRGPKESPRDSLRYSGFWRRFRAVLIDTIILLIITIPILISLYGWDYFESEALVAGIGDFLISWVFPAAATLVFWVYKQATPGKMLLRMKIIDAKNGSKPSILQYIIRYAGYFVSMIPFGLGYLWIVWDPQKQGWHDKLAGTIVVHAID